MCNDLVWAVSGRQFPTLPSFTERVNAADGGIDAEWEIEVANTSSVLPTPIVGPGWNVFQYKKRDLIAQDRRRVISNIKSSLKGTLINLGRERDRTPDHYVLFLNIDLKHDQTISLKKAILEGYDQALEIHVEIIGAAEIAALLNSQPHLRAAYFTPLAFKTWQEANRSHRAQKLFGFDVDLVGRQEELSRLCALVDNPHVRAVIIAGAHDIGKSRLVLEATSHRPQDVVFALDPRSMTVDDYRNLLAEQSNIVCVVEDPEPDRVQKLVNEMLGNERLKLLITLPTSDEAPTVSYGIDDRIQCISLGPLNDEGSRKLLSATGKRLDFSVESWILDRAGGNPGILLAAASIGETLRDKRESFETAVGRELAKRIESALGKDALKCTELVSLLTHVGVSGNFESEIKLIVEVFGDGQWHPSRVLAEQRILERAGLAKRGGSFAEITIPFLANYLVTNLLRGRRGEIFALFARLPEPGRIRFIRRLAQIKTQEVDQLWDALFDDPQSPFGSLKSALRQEDMLRFIAGATPERTLRFLERQLLHTSHEERLAISGESRRELMWALEQLLFRAKTSRGALTLIWLLAEAENENWGNNAEGVLSECFHPTHPQLPLPLDERINALKEFTSEVAAKNAVLVAIRAASRALERSAVSLRASTGTEPLDKGPVFAQSDAYEYARSLVDLFFRIAAQADPDVAKEALEKLPRMVLALGFQGQPKKAIEGFERLIDWATSEKSGLELFSVVENLDALSEGFQDALQESRMTDDEKNKFEGYLTKCKQLESAVENGTFGIRLKRWAGGLSREDHRKIVVDGIETYRSCLELNRLAKETIVHPSSLTAELFSWLVSAKPQNAHIYFFELGKEDSEGRLSLKFEELGAHIYGARAFSAYWGGWSSSNRIQAESRLISLANSTAVTGEAIVLATSYMGPSEAILHLIRTKLLEGYLKADIVSGILYGDWIKGLSIEQFLGLVEAMAGSQYENAAISISIIGRWIHEGQPLERELVGVAWQYLEALPQIGRDEASRFDELASKLAESDPARAFSLLEKLLRVTHERHIWNPIERFGPLKNHFWAVLHKIDRERAIRIVICAALAESKRHYWITSDFKEILDQSNDAEILTKLATEHERIAQIIADSITTARPGFWPLAFQLIEKYPRNLNIQDALTSGIELAEGGWGPYSSHLASSRLEVKRVLDDPTTPSAARPWLQRVLAGLESDVNRNIVWEYDRDVNDLRRSIEEKGSPERIWAIGRVLKFSDLKDIRRLLTVDDIAEVLPQVDLPDKKRKALERALEVWQGGT